MGLVIPTSHLAKGPAHRPVLGYFVMGSVLLHALLAGLWWGEKPAGPSSANSTFQVTLLAHHGDATSNPGNAEQAVPAHTPDLATGATDSTSTADHALVDAAQQLAALEVTTQATPLQAATKTSHNKTGKTESLTAVKTRATTMSETPSRAQQKQASARNGSASYGRHQLTSAARYRKIRTALQEALLPHFDYPPLARRRGWQGRVNVGLHVEADGDLTRIRLVESSGYMLLDRTAVRNITELRNIPLATQWLEGNGMDMVLPVRYKLTD